METKHYSGLNDSEVQQSRKQFGENIAANEPENFTFANLVNRENCLTGESFVSHNIMDYAISHSDQFTPEQRARIRHVLLYSPLIPGPKAVQEADTRSAPDGLMELPIRTAK